MIKVNFSKPLLIQSVAFKDVFLRMDGNGITQANGAGTGKVSCQKNMSPTGAFKVQEQKNGTFTIESVKYPGGFLRMDGNNRSGKEEDFGTVNCQYGASTCEKFYLLNMPETGKVKDMFNKFAK